MATFRNFSILFFALLGSAAPFVPMRGPLGYELSRWDLNKVRGGVGDCQEAGAGGEACEICIVTGGIGRKCKVSEPNENCQPIEEGTCVRCEEVSPNPTCPARTL